MKHVKHMKRLMITGLMGVFLSFNLFAQGTPEAEVEKSMNSLSAAIIAADQKMLDSLTLSEVVYGHSDDRIQNKAEFIDSLVTKKSVMTKIDLSNQKISIVGDLAFVSNHMSADVAPGGKPGHVELNIFYVWKKTGDSWKLLARKAFKG